MIQIRKANTWDTMGIAAVKRHTWPDATTSEVQIAIALSNRKQHALVALDHGRIIAYLSAFISKSVDDNPRWEIDEIAVDPDHRRQGIATALIEQSLKDSHVQDTQLSRALIQIENEASQASFQKSGFKPTQDIYRLYIVSEANQSALALPRGLHMVHVTTFSYRGIWLEGELSDSALDNAKGLCYQEDIDLVGVLIRHQQEARWQMAENYGYQYINDYQWWVK